MRILLLLTLLAITPGVMATHIVGGEIYYTDLPGNTYLITLKVYRDCGPDNSNQTGFDDFAKVGIFNSNGGLVMNLEMNLSSAEVNYVPVSLNNPCFVLPPDVCVQEAIYQEEVDLPPTAGGYTLAYQRCCRNPSIVNIVSPQDSGVTFTTQIPGTNQTTAANSNPQFETLPPVALCLNAAFTFDHSATDIDGDVLVYEFCTPLHGASPDDPAPNPSPPPYSTINWDTGFSSGYQITSNPAFTIDPNTGWMEGTATQLGKFVIGICVSEYRNGVLLSTTNRDFQFNVTTCDPSIVSGIPEQEDFCTGLTLTFSNSSDDATSFFWDFGVPGTDADTSNLESPSFTYPEEGMYEVTLIANPGWTCADTSSQWFEVNPLIEPQIIFEGFECVNDVELYSFSATSNATASATYFWDFGPGSTPQTSTDEVPQGIHLNQEDDLIEVTLTISDQSCDETATLTVDNPPDPVAVIDPQNSFCDGLEYQFTESSLNADVFHWDFGNDGSPDLTNTQEPLWEFPDTGLYVVNLTVFSDLNCPDEMSLPFQIYGLLDPFFETPGPQCMDGNSFSFDGEGASTPEAIFSWDFQSAVPATTLSGSPSGVHFTAPGTYAVELTISENGCTESYLDSIWVVANPTIDFEIENPQGCPLLMVAFSDLSTAETTIGYSWNFGDGSTSNAQNPVHYYDTPGVYDVSLTINTSYGCIQTLTLSYADTVRVNPVPVPGFNVDPGLVDILNPVVQVTADALNATSVSYYMSDGGFSDQWDFTYEWTQAGEQYIEQIVSNEFGCVASAIGYVYINGHLFWVPNTFTPNGDGINDVWQPVYTGVRNYHVKIFDRWGTQVYESTDPSVPWMGNIRGGGHFAEDGIYQYIITFDDLLSFPHEAEGHIVLTR